ncbi:hypothetical protein OAC85_02820 [Flavobacteriaceae bacterium]|nr:hypothetical protein [Flavobacteriaceae bacterium]
MNREYHSLNTKFNVLFNGEEALDIGAAILASQAQDNFLTTIPKAESIKAQKLLWVLK